MTNRTSRGATEDTLGELHELIAKGLIAKLKSGEATPADYNAAIKFLKDNDISCIGSQNDDMKELVDSLPDYDEMVFMNHNDPQQEADSVLRAH